MSAPPPPPNQQDVAYLPHGSASPPPVLAISEEEIRKGRWQLAYLSSVMLPETVLVADISKQKYCIYPREFYVDIQRQCRTCARPFIFYTVEQRHWFETLCFHVDPDCVHCPSCRVARREPRAMQQRLRRYAALLAQPSHTPNELGVLVDEALELMQRAAQRNLNKLGAVKNEGLKTIPEYPGTIALAEALAQALAEADAVKSAV